MKVFKGLVFFWVVFGFWFSITNTNIANAQSFEADINLMEDPLTTCPTITSGETPLDHNDIGISVTNLNSKIDTFDLMFELPEGWSGFPVRFNSLDQNTLTLGSGETGDFEILWLTVPDVAPGVYTLKANVKSGLTGQVIKKEFRIEILKCRGVTLNLISERLQKTCSESPSEIEYSFQIKNDGKVKETFDMTALSGGKETGWVEFSPGSITLGPGEVGQIDLAVTDPPETLAGLHSIEVVAMSQASYARNSQVVEFDLTSCYDFKASLQPQSATTCLGKVAEYSLTIENTGNEEDTFSFSSEEFVQFSPKEMLIPAGGKKTTNIIAIPEREGDTTFEIIVVPENDKNNAQKTIAALKAKECSGVAVVSITPDIKVCKGEEAKASFIIKNIGTLEDTFQLSSNIGTLTEDKIILKAQEVATVEVNIETSELPESDKLLVTAKSNGETIDQDTIDVSIENCYDAKVSVSPEAISLCRSEEGKFTVDVDNTGTKEDTYQLIFGDQKIAIQLEPGDSKTLDFALPVEYEKEGDYRLIAALTSDNIDLVDEAMITIKPVSECYSVKLEGQADVIRIEPGKATTVPITVKNTGKSTTTYTLTIDGPDWAYLNPGSLSIGTSESKDAYVYISPRFDTEEGKYEIKVGVKSDFAESESELTIIVGETEEENKSMEKPEAGRGFFNFTGLLFGGERAPLRLVIVGLIAIIIIVILIIRFVMLYK